MKNAIHRRGLTGRTLALVVGLLIAAGVAAQSSPPAAKPAAPSKAAKPAKKSAAPEYKLVLEPRAMDLLKATSARLAAAKSMSFTATVGYEYPSKLGPPIEYRTRYDVTMQRPDKLKVVMPGDGPASEFYYDGKQMMAFAPAENVVAVVDAPATIDAALKAAYDTAAIYYPFSDFVVADPYAALTDRAVLAFYVGPSGSGGGKTDMVAWANDDVFLQIWIGVDDKLPRRIRAVFRTDPLRASATRWSCRTGSSTRRRAGSVRLAEGASRQAHRVSSPVATLAGRQTAGKVKPGKAEPPGNQRSAMRGDVL